MGQIREDFILADNFSATFSRFLQMGQGAVDRFGELDKSNQQFAQSTVHASRMMDSMRDALAAQQMLHAAQSQRLEAQGQKVQELSEKYRRLAADQGEESAAAVKAAEALARAQISEQALLQQSLKTEEAISRQNTAIQEFTKSLETANRTEAPATWKSDALQVFTGTGAGRFKDELKSVNDMLSQLEAAQESIGQKAQGVDIFPERALEDMNMLAERLNSVGAGVERLGGGFEASDADKMNAELEQLRSQLGQAVQEQQLLNEAVSGMDIQAANEAYLRLSQTIGGAEKRIRDNIDGMEQFDRNIKDVNESCERLTGIFGKTQRQIEDNIDSQMRFSRELKNSGEQAGSLLRTIGGVVAAYASAQTAAAGMDLSDQLTSTSARLEMVIGQIGSVSGGLQTVEELQDMIFQSAERSRGAYQATADAVSKLGLMAGGAFSGTEEIVAFMEQINKQFTIAGTEASGIQAAMLQLTQAMGSGVLRGEEYNSILEQAPNIIQNIAGYIEDNEDVLAAVADGMKMKAEDLVGNVQKHLKDIAGEGLISAELVKAAMFASADETNRKFESMPKTFGQLWTSFQNNALKAFEPVFQRMSEIANSESFQDFMDRSVYTLAVLGDAAADTFDVMISGASWAADNLDMILPVLAAIGIAYGIVHGQALLAGAANVAGALASAAAWAVVHWPILLIGAAIAGALMSAQEFGIGMEEVGGMTGAAFGMIYSVGYNTFANLWNLIASFAEFFANVWNDPLAATARLFFDVFDSILGIVETVAGAIDSLLGSDMAGAVSGFRGEMSGWVGETFGENAVKIKRMANLDVKDTVGEWGDAGSDLGSKLDNMDLDLSLKSIADGLKGFEDFSGFTPALQSGAGDIGKVGSVGNVKNVEGEIRLADEDVRLYRDLAERRYMNQIELKTLAPTIHVAMQAGPGGSTEPKSVAEEIKKMLIEQIAAQTAVSHG